MRLTYSRHSSMKAKTFVFLLALASASAQQRVIISGAGDAPVVRQKTSQTSSGSVASINKAFASSTVKGNTLVTAFCNGNVNAPSAPISDTQANTWRLAIHQVNGSAFECDIWYAVATAGGSNTVTVTPGGANASIALEIYEISGLVALGPDVVDQTNSSSGTGTALSSGAVTALSPNELAIAAFGVGTAAQTITVGGGFTNDSGQLNPTTPAGLFSMASASRSAPSFFSSITASATITSEPWVAAVATFRPIQLSISGSFVLRDAAGNGRGVNVTASNELLVSVNNTAAMNITQVGGNTALAGNGATGTGSLRVTLANDSSAIAGKGEGATGATVPSGAQYIGGNGSGNLTGLTVCDTWAAVSQTANAQIITGVSAKKIYICSINLVTATTQNVAVVSGTGSVCGTGVTSVPGMSGGTTAAAGWNFYANAGIATGSGLGAIARTTNNADNLCILQSGSGQLSGGISYTIF